MNLPTILTQNCVLRIPTSGDETLLQGYYSRNKKFLEQWEPFREADFYKKRYWQSDVINSHNLFKQKQGVKLIALNKNQSMVVGICNFNNIVLGGFLACHLGFSVDEEHQGKGLMQEILKAGIKFMYDEFSLHRIMANHLPENYRSQRLLNKLGFEQEGFAKSYLKINGKWQDHVLNSLILPSK